MSYDISFYLKELCNGLPSCLPPLREKCESTTRLPAAHKTLKRRHCPLELYAKDKRSHFITAKTTMLFLLMRCAEMRVNIQGADDKLGQTLRTQYTFKTIK